MDNNGVLTSILYGLEGYHGKKVCIISSFADMHAFYFTRFHVLVFMTMCNL